MKKLGYIFLLLLVISSVLAGCGGKNKIHDNANHAGDSENKKPQNNITEEMAYEGVNNYCHKEYDWSMAEDNPDMMYVEMGEETESEYQVIFRSYTGAFVYFYVNKTTGITRMIESVPNLGIEEETGTIDLHDYLD